MKGNEALKGQNERPKRPKSKELTSKSPKGKEMKAQKAKMKGISSEEGPGPSEQKLKGNESPKGQNERKARPKRPK